MLPPPRGLLWSIAAVLTSTKLTLAAVTVETVSATVYGELLVSGGSVSSSANGTVYTVTNGTDTVKLKSGSLWWSSSIGDATCISVEFSSNIAVDAYVTHDTDLEAMLGGKYTPKTVYTYKAQLPPRPLPAADWENVRSGSAVLSANSSDTYVLVLSNLHQQAAENGTLLSTTAEISYRLTAHDQSSTVCAAGDNGGYPTSNEPVQENPDLVPYLEDFAVVASNFSRFLAGISNASCASFQVFSPPSTKTSNVDLRVFLMPLNSSVVALDSSAEFPYVGAACVMGLTPTADSSSIVTVNSSAAERATYNATISTQQTCQVNVDDLVANQQYMIWAKNFVSSDSPEDLLVRYTAKGSGSCSEVAFPAPELNFASASPGPAVAPPEAAPSGAPSEALVGGPTEALLVPPSEALLLGPTEALAAISAPAPGVAPVGPPEAQPELHSASSSSGGELDGASASTPTSSPMPSATPPISPLALAAAPLPPNPPAPSSSTTSPPTSATALGGTTPPVKDLSAGALAGIAAAAVVCIVLAVFVGFLVSRKRRHRHAMNIAGKGLEPEGQGGLSPPETEETADSALSWKEGDELKETVVVDAIGMMSPLPVPDPKLDEYLLPVMPAVVEAREETAGGESFAQVLPDSSTVTVKKSPTGSVRISQQVPPGSRTNIVHQTSKEMQDQDVPANIQTSSRKDRWQIKAEDILISMDEKDAPIELGCGAYGTVFKATIDNVTEVAVKVFHDVHTEQEQAAIMREVSTLKNCRDRHIVQFLGACFLGEHIMLVTEYMEGGDLWQALHEYPEMVSWYNRGQDIAIQVARGLHYLHRNNIFHCDLKSSNVLLTREGAAKISDVGFANILSHSELKKPSAVSLLAWAAPEVLMGAACTEKVDIFSYGVLLWELVTGEQPRSGLGQLRECLVPDECPAEIRQLIQQCLSFQPEDRPSCREVVEILIKHQQTRRPYSSFSGSPQGSFASTPRSGTARLRVSV